MNAGRFEERLANAVRAEVESLLITEEERQAALREVRARLEAKENPSGTLAWKRAAFITAVAVVVFSSFALLTTRTAMGRVIREYFQSVSRGGSNPVITVKEGQKPVVPPSQTPPSAENKTPDINEIVRRTPFAVVIPGVLPSNAVLQKAGIMEPYSGKAIVWLKFGSETTWIELFQTNSLGVSGESNKLDADRYTVEEVSINGTMGKLATPKEPSIPSILIWTKADVHYQMTGNVEPKTLVKIARSLKPIKP